MTIFPNFNYTQMKSFKFFFAVQLVIVFLALAGEVQCIYKAINCDWSNDTSWKSEIVYTASAVTGLGAVVGWMNIEDK